MSGFRNKWSIRANKLVHTIGWIKLKFRNNWFRIILSLLSILIALVYVFKWRNPNYISDKPDYFNILGLRWLESALIVSLIMSAITFYMGLFREKGFSELRCTQQIGMIIGALLYLFLFGLFIVQFTDKAVNFHLLLFILVIVALIVAIVDALLRLPGWAIKLDIILFFTLFLTFFIPRWYSSPIQNSSFILGFHSGAAAFQLMLANLTFDPNLYLEIYKKRKGQ